jgi:hypothetical protein
MTGGTTAARIRTVTPTGVEIDELIHIVVDG